MTASSRVERLGTDGIGKLLLDMSSQTTLALLVYAIYSVTGAYFLSLSINSLAAAGSSIISPVLIALGRLATTVGTGGASVVSRAVGANDHPLFDDLVGRLRAGRVWAVLARAGGHDWIALEGS